jgi:hypothetical protein
MAVAESSEQDWPQRRRVMKTTFTDRTVEQLIPLPNRVVLRSSLVEAARRARAAPFVQFRWSGWLTHQAV